MGLHFYFKLIWNSDIEWISQNNTLNNWTTAIDSHDLQDYMSDDWMYKLSAWSLKDIQIIQPKHYLQHVDDTVNSLCVLYEGKSHKNYVSTKTQITQMILKK